MKIGEVLEKTGLTDRAVRLYIEHGLISPTIEKGYSGRKSYVFSEEDVQKLRRISLLRKADFSISQIEKIDNGGEEAEAAFSEFMNLKREKHALDGEIIGILDKFTGEVTLKNVASALEVGGADKMENADMVPTKAEIREKRIYTALGVTMIVGSSLWLLFLILLNLGLFYGFYRHLKIEPRVVWIHLLIWIPTFIGLWCGIDIIKKYKNCVRVPDKWSRRGEALGGFVIAVILWLFSFHIQIVAAGFVPFAYSHTTNVENYLVLDDWPSWRGADNINAIFPACVPKESQDQNCEYYYKYSTLVESSLEIVAQWNLDDDAFEKEKQRITNLHPDVEIYQKGNYTCVDVVGTRILGTDRNIYGYTGILFFAYNDETKTVRYIYREDIEGLDPYFETLDW